MHTSERKRPREETERLGEQIALLSSQIDATIHRLLTAIREFDAAEGWGAQGALSCAHWLTWRIGVGPGAAREYVRVARALAHLPKIDDALRLGSVSYCKVRALTRCAAPENEESLLVLAMHSTGAQLEKIVAKYRRVLRVEGYIPVDDPDFRFVRKSETQSGMVRITAQLLPDEAAVVMKALEIARGHASRSPADVSAETPAGLGERLEAERRDTADRVDGLLWLAEATLAGQVGDASAKPVEVVVHVDASAIEGAPESVMEDGRRLEPETTARLLCDTGTVVVVEDDTGTALDVGRRTRTIPPALRRALRTRDGGCRFPSCSRTRTDGHHIVPWAEGGATALGNLVSLCRRHHRFVHEAGWRIEIRDGNELLFYDPDDRLVPRAPLRESVGDAAIDSIRTRLASEGIDIDAETARPRGDGVIDWDFAIGTLAQSHIARVERATSADVSAETWGRS